MKVETAKLKIILAEDEPSLGMIIKESLEHRDFQVQLCEDGEEALKSFLVNGADLVIMDVMMPKLDGFSLAKEIRRNNKDIPIIFLTARSQTSDVVQGFEFGGNDYIKKPFSMDELVIRTLALLKKAEVIKEDEARSKIGIYKFDHKRQCLIYKKKELILTNREADILLHLLKNKNQIVTRTYLLLKIWGDDDFFNGRSLDVFITKLRKKLKEDDSIHIVNTRGLGYKLIC